MTSDNVCFYDANRHFARDDMMKMFDKHGLIDKCYGDFDYIVPTKDDMMKMFDKNSSAAERRTAELAYLCEVLKLKIKSQNVKINKLKDEKEDYKYYFHCAQDALKEANKSNA